MISCVGTLSLFLLFALSNAFQFPRNKELIYDYHATTEVAFDGFTDSLKKFEIFAKINIRFYLDEGEITENLVFQMQNVTYTVYSEGNHSQSEKNQLPPEAEDLLLPFLLKFYRNAFDYFHFEKTEDASWSRDMKRSIASLFLIDGYLMEYDGSVGSQRWTTEDLHFGNCDVLYKSLKSIDGHIEFTKEISNILPNHRLSSSHRLDDCHAIKDTLPNSKIYQKYDVLKSEKEFHINSVQSNNKISATFHKNTFVTFVNSELKLNHMKDRTERYLYIPMLTPAKVGYKPTYDLTRERRSYNSSSVKSKVKKNLDSIVDRIRDVRINTSNIDSDESENAIVLIEQMKMLDDEALYDLCKEYYKDKYRFQMLISFLPLVGTLQSMTAIHRLIHEKVVDEEKAVQVLREIPFHIGLPNLIYLDILMKFVKGESNYSRPIREAAILAASGMIQGEPSFLYIQVEEFKGYFREHFEYFKEKFEKASDYDEQLLYMSALSNTKIWAMNSYLEEVISDRKFSPHIRTLAIIAHMNYAISIFDDEAQTIEDFLMNILFNAEEDFEVRATALRYILYFGNAEKMVKLFWYMRTETDEKLLRLFHSGVESISKSSSHCHRSKLENVKSLVKYFKKPRIDKVSEWFVKIINYFDERHGFESMVKVSLYGKKTITVLDTMYLEYTWSFEGYNFDQYAVYMYVKADPSVSFSSLSVVDILMLPEEKVSIEIIVYRNSLVIKLIKTSPKNISEYFSDLERIFNHPLTYSAQHHFNSELQYVSDIGFPVIVYLKKPSVTFSAAKKVGDLIPLHWSEWNRGQFGMKIYNPIIDQWQGVQRVQTEYMHLCAIIEIDNPNKLKWSVFGSDLPLGYKSTVHTEAFTDSGETKPTSIVLNQNPAHEEFVYWSVDDKNSGQIYNFKIFNCEAQNIIKVKEQIKRLFSSISERSLLANLYIIVQKVVDYMSVFPVDGSCGVIMNVKKSENSNVVKYITEYVKETESLKFIIKAIDLNRIDKEFHISLNGGVKSNGNFSVGFEFENIQSELHKELPNSIFRIDAERYLQKEEVHTSIVVLSGDKQGEEIKEKSELNINIAGKPSKEQIDHDDREIESYKSCTNESMNDMNECIKDLTSFRSYEYYISYKKSESSHLNILERFIDFLKDSLIRKLNTINKIDERKVEMTLEYPTARKDVVDLSFTGSNKSFRLPIDNFIFKEPFSMFDSLDYIPKLYCEFSTSSLKDVSELNVQNFTLNTNWTRMTSDCIHESFTWEINAKRIEESSNLMALRITINDEIIDLYVDQDVKMFVNDTVFDISKDSRYHYTKWTDVKVFKDDHRVLVHLKTSQANVDFNGTYAKISMPWNTSDGICHSYKN